MTGLFKVLLKKENRICIKWHVCQQRQTSEKSETFYMRAVDIFICNHAVKSPSALKCTGAVKSPRGGCAGNYWTEISKALAFFSVHAPGRGCCTEVWVLLTSRQMKNMYTDGYVVEILVNICPPLMWFSGLCRAVAKESFCHCLEMK